MSTTSRRRERPDQGVDDDQCRPDRLARSIRSSSSGGKWAILRWSCSSARDRSVDLLGCPAPQTALQAGEGLLVEAATVLLRLELEPLDELLGDVLERERGHLLPSA